MSLAIWIDTSPSKIDVANFAAQAHTRSWVVAIAQRADLHALPLKKVKARITDDAGKSALSHEFAVGKRGWLGANFPFHQEPCLASNATEFNNIGCYAIGL